MVDEIIVENTPTCFGAGENIVPEQPMSCGELVLSDTEKTIYMYHYFTKEYVGLMRTPVETGISQQQNKLVYYRVGNTTFIAPPQRSSETEVAVFDIPTLTWSLQKDYRGGSYELDGNKITIDAIGIDYPEGATNIIYPPPKTFQKPEYINGEWVDTQLVFHGYNVSTKADVDGITTMLITNLGEDKAKTEKLIAGDGPCPIWDEFVAARALLLQENDDFITANNLI